MRRWAHRIASTPLLRLQSIALPALADRPAGRSLRPDPPFDLIWFAGWWLVTGCDGCARADAENAAAARNATQRNATPSNATQRHSSGPAPRGREQRAMARRPLRGYGSQLAAVGTLRVASPLVPRIIAARDVNLQRRPHYNHRTRASAGGAERDSAPQAPLLTSVAVSGYPIARAQRTDNEIRI